MDLTVHIPDEAVPALKAKASGLPLETFAERVLLERIQDEGAQAPGSSVADAARRQTVTLFVLDTSIVLTWCFPDEVPRILF